MKFKAYAESFLPERYVILGIELKPLSLGHYLLMRRFDVGYATDADKSSVGWDDFVMGLLICSMTHEQFIDLLNNKVDGKQAKCRWLWWRDDHNYFMRYLKRQSKLLKQRIKKEKGFNLLSKMGLFNYYIRRGTIMPKYWEGDHASDKESGAHWSQIIFTSAISDLGYTRSEALNIPLTQLFNDFFRFAESQGAIELMRDDEEELVEEMESKV